jgi:hypothetical protein
MERHRKIQEAQNLLARAERCRERCAEIDIEVRQLMAILDKGRMVEIAEPKATRPIPTATGAELAAAFHSY